MLTAEIRPNGRSLQTVSWTTWALLLSAPLITLLLLNSPSWLIGSWLLAGVAGAAVVWSAFYTTRHKSWLIFALLLIELLLSADFIPDEVRTPSRYVLEALFCLPIIPYVWRSGILRRGGFALFAIYFLWAIVTASYSLAPTYSFGRAVAAVLLFCALIAAALEVHDDQDVTNLLEHFLFGCTAVLAVVVLAALVLPHDLTWVSETIEGGASADNFDRFRGIFSSPNQIGELMLTTISPALLCWPTVRGWKRLWCALTVVTSVVLAGMADSRSPFIGLAVGCAVFLLWKYRLRGLLAGLVLLLVALVSATTVSYQAREYFTRGDVVTLTGRTEAWDFAIEKLKEHPWAGYGYEVEGQIYQSRYFPVWWGPWDEGPRSSLHNGYLSHAIGVGLPATLLWLFVLLRPWVKLFTRVDDPWRLKPIALLGVVPIMTVNLAESSAQDCRYSLGLLLILCWAIAERARLDRPKSAQKVSVAAAKDSLSPLVAAIVGTLLLTAAQLPFASPASAREFFVDSRGGNDSNDGLSRSSALRSLAAVEGLPLVPGDRILLARGATWHEMLKIDWHGTADAPITLGSYGGGPPPVITGADPIANLQAACGGRCYSASETKQAERILVDGEGFASDHRRSSPADLGPGTWAQQAGKLYLRLRGNLSPRGHQIEAVHREWGIRCWGCRYATFEGIEVYGAWDDGISIDGPARPAESADHILVRHCVVHDIGRGDYDETGIQAGSTYADSITVEDNQIYDIGLGRGFGSPIGDGGIGILFNHCDFCVARSNKVHDVGHIGIAAQITDDLKDGTPGPRQALLLSNQVYDCPGRIPGLDRADAIYLRRATEAQVAGNQIWNIASTESGAGNAFHIGPQCDAITIDGNRTDRAAAAVYIDDEQRGITTVSNNRFGLVTLFFNRIPALGQSRVISFKANDYLGPAPSKPFVVGAQWQTAAEWHALAEF